MKKHKTLCKKKNHGKDGFPKTKVLRLQPFFSENDVSAKIQIPNKTKRNLFSWEKPLYLSRNIKKTVEFKAHKRKQRNALICKRIGFILMLSTKLYWDLLLEARNDSRNLGHRHFLEKNRKNVQFAENYRIKISTLCLSSQQIFYESSIAKSVVLSFYFL